MDGSIEMDKLILIIRIIAWPFVVLTVVALFLFLFKKQIANRLEQLKKADVRKGFFEFGESPKEDAKVMEEITNKNQEYLVKLGKEIEGVSYRFLIEKHAKKLIENLDAYSRRLDFLEQFGFSIKSEDYINRGFDLINKNKYESALEAFENVISLEPDNFRAWLGKGIALNKLTKKEEVLKASEKLIELNPDEAVGWSNTSGSLVNLGRYKEALVASEEAIKRIPAYGRAWCNKGAALLGLQRYDEETFKALIKAVNLDPEIAVAWWNLAYNFSVNEDRENMLTCLEKTIELNPLFKESAKRDEVFKEYWNDKDFKKIIS